MRVIRRCGAWLILLGLWGCATQPIVRQEIITVTGRGYASDFSAPKVETPSRYMSYLWSHLSLEAKGMVGPQADVANPLQRKVMTQLQARSNAKRSLAQKVEELKVTENATLAKYLQTHPDLRPKVEELIRNAELVEEDELPDGTWSARVELKLGPLAGLVEPERLAKPVEPKEIPAQTTRQKAEAQAIRNARDRLTRYLQGLEIEPGITVFELMRRDPAFSQHLKTMVDNAPIIDRRYPHEGVCEVDVEFDLAALRQLVY
jgi:hypothetical protein